MKYPIRGRRFTPSRRFYDTSLALTRDLNQKAEQGIVLHRIANVYREKGEMSKALENYNLALSIFRIGADYAGLAFALTNRGAVYESLG
jgi:hypothetical protein